MSFCHFIKCYSYDVSIKPYPDPLIIHIYNGSGTYHEWMTKAEVIHRKYLMPEDGSAADF